MGDIETLTRLLRRFLPPIASFMICTTCMGGQKQSALPSTAYLQNRTVDRLNSSSVDSLKKQSEQLLRLVDSHDYASCQTVASTIWTSVNHSNLTERDFPDLPRILSVIASLYLNIYHDTPTGISVLKYVAGLPKARIATSNKATSFEWAAAQLGEAYYDGACQRNASYWLNQAIEFTKSRHLSSDSSRDFTISNLWLLANASAFLGDSSNELKYNREILQLTGEHPTSRAGLKYLVQVGHSEVRQGDFDLGIRLLDTFRHEYKPTTDEEMTYTVQAYLSEGYAQLEKQHYAQVDQLVQEGLQLVETASDPSLSAGKVEWRDAMNALAARSLVRQGRYEQAEHEILKIYKANEINDTYSPATAVGNIELLEDLARVYVHFGQFADAFPAYISLARHYGELIGDPRRAGTPRVRMYWLYQENAVVQELASVWLSLPSSAVKKQWESPVANALLQVKANLFLAMTLHRATAYHKFEGLDAELFAKNRRYANAAIKALDDPSDGKAWYDLEDAFLARDNLEAHMVGSPMELMSSGSREFGFDFQKLFQYYDKTALLDYSLIDFAIPRDGVRQQTTKRIFIGIKVTHGNSTIVELGTEDDIAAKIKPFLEDVARPPREGEGISKVLKDGSIAFDAIVGPFGELPDSIYISTDGFLSGVPFPALVHGTQFLIEKHNVWISHSMLTRDALYWNQASGMTADMYDNRAVVLIGDPDYTGTTFASLKGTKKEVEDIQHLFAMTALSPVIAHSKLVVSTGPNANVDAILSSPHPLVLHIAAHGEFWPGDVGPEPHFTPLDEPINPEPELMEGPLSPLDEALLRSAIILSPEQHTGSPAEGRRLTALELSSLNLLNSYLLILSACDTGLGTESRAAGVLGFQYAVQATMVRYALLSLWKINDNDSAAAVRSFYNKWMVQKRDISDAYTLTLRELCRDRNMPVHPFYWAAFMLIKQDY